MNRLILLVEDDQDDEILTIDALKSAGIANEVDVVRDGAEALDYIFSNGEYAGPFARTLPAVILLDLKLPKVPGLEVLRRIRANETTKRLPVVVLTSSDEESDLRASYGNGANSYVRKPVHHQEFMQAVRQLGVYWLERNIPPAD